MPARRCTEGGSWVARRWTVGDSWPSTAMRLLLGDTTAGAEGCCSCHAAASRWTMASAMAAGAAADFGLSAGGAAAAAAAACMVAARCCPGGRPRRLGRPDPRDSSVQVAAVPGLAAAGAKAGAKGAGCTGGAL